MAENTSTSSKQPVEVSKLIDLTDKPIGLTRDEIGWAKVRANASNCICCCNNNSITLVTTENSYVLDHVPLENIQFAQTSPNLQHLALSNHRKLVIIDLINNNSNCCACTNNGDRSHNKQRQNGSKEVMVVNLTGFGLTMADIVFWRWLDNQNLAVLSYEALYTCSIDQTNIKHPAYTAIQTHERTRHLNLERIFDSHPHLSALCQVTDVQRDATGNLYAISSLYSTSSLCQLTRPSSSSNITTPPTSPDGANPPASGHPLQAPTSKRNPLLKPSFGSMPSRLSQLAHMDQHSFDSIRHEYLLDHRRSQQQAAPPSPTVATTDMICGLAQIYCRKRDRSQLIQAHAVAYTSSMPPPSSPPSSSTPSPTVSATITTSSVDVGEDFSFTRHHRPRRESPSAGSPAAASILIAANKCGSDRMRVHFIEMATSDQWPSGHSGQNASPTTTFNHLSSSGDFPTAIVCSYIRSDNDNHLHLAMITTKRGQLFVCSVTHSTILFNTSISPDIISSTVLESNTGGLMVVCRNGQVLLVRLNLARLMKLLEESKALRHISSTHSFLNSLDLINNNGDEQKPVENKKSQRKSESSLRPMTNGSVHNPPQPLSTSLEHLEVTMSTRL